VGAVVGSLLLESIPLYIFLTILLGLPIGWAETQANQPYLCTFGMLFWAGHVLTRVVAALARAWLSTYQLSPAVLEGTFIGMSVFTFVYVAILVRSESSAQRWRDPNRIEVDWPKAAVACGVIAIISTILVNIVGLTPRGTQIHFGPLFNVIAGIENAVYLLPAVFLGLSVADRSWQYTILVGISWVSIFIGSVLQSGRSVFLMNVLIAAFTWSMFQSESKKLRKLVLILAILSLFTLMLLGAYRSKYNPYLSTSSRVQRLWRTITEFEISTNYLQRQAVEVADRLYEPPSVELLLYSLQSGARDPWYALDQLLFMYVPKFLFPEKGSGTYRDLLYELGFVSYSEVSGAPVILIADAYYRGGASGVVIVYALTGVVLAWLATRIWHIDNPVLSVAFMSIIGYEAFRAYDSDVYRIVTWWFYQIPKLVLFSISIFAVTGVFDHSKILDWLKGTRSR
jgi:hypothetical protein